MNFYKLAITIALLFTTMYAISEETIPVVPVSVMNNKNNVNDVKITKSEQVIKQTSSNIITVKNGVNELIPIGIGHGNRIVTPFSTPSVMSSSLDDSDNEGVVGTIKIQDNVIYVTTGQDYPISMFIREAGSEQRAINVTLIPKRIPPREIQLKLDDTFSEYSFVNKKAQAWETSQPYIDTIKNLFRTIALGEIPSGYNISKVKNDMNLPKCAQKGITVDFNKGQVLSGHNLIVYIGVAKNISNAPIEFNEMSCGDRNTAAVTVWPYHTLEKGQTTEIYVATKIIQYSQKNSRFRPSLLN